MDYPGNAVPVGPGAPKPRGFYKDYLNKQVVQFRNRIIDKQKTWTLTWDATLTVAKETIPAGASEDVKQRILEARTQVEQWGKKGTSRRNSRYMTYPAWNPLEFPVEYEPTIRE